MCKLKEYVDKFREKNKRIFKLGGVFILIGGILILFSQYIIVVHNIPSSDKLSYYFFKSLLELGFSFISMGIIGIILAFPDWQKYFQERLAEIIIERNYLDTLDESELIRLQTSTLKALFKADIDKEGSFLNYFHSRIQDFIGSPFRENILATLHVEISDNADRLNMSDTVSYICKKVGEQIQEKIKWSSTEFLEMQDFKIKIKCPPNYKDTCKNKCEYSNTQCCQEILFPKEKLTTSIPGEYALDLKQFRHIDGLNVTVETKYVVLKNRHQTWQMAHPTKRFTFTIGYPKTLQIDVDPFGIAKEDELHIINKPGLYIMKYDSWALPNSGLAYTFRDVSNKATP